MAFYSYNQNNSGGSFDVDDKVCHRIFIEAFNEAEADFKAEELGVYFNGVEDGRDCPCCGERWGGGYAVEFPLDYDGRGTVFSDVVEYAQYLADEYGWTTPDCRIYYADGRVLEVFTRGKN